jgi:ankyrin repeat protein
VPRADTAELIGLLLRHGADPNQRGLNDYTALHMAVSVNHPEAIDVLLAGGADPRLRTRIDECETPRESAQRAGLAEVAERLRAAEELRRR